MRINSMPRLVSAAAMGLMAIITLFGSYYTVGQGERGAIIRFGKLVGEAQPGLGFKIPFAESVILIPVTQQTTFYDCPPSQATCNGLYQMQAYSQDQQPANMRVSILWHVTSAQVPDVYARYGSLDLLEANLIARKAPQDVKTVFGHYTAPEVIQKRGQFNAEVASAVEQDIDGPVVVDAVQVENIDFSDAYEQAVEARMTAQVQVQQKQQQEYQEEINAKIAVVQAQGRADSVVAEAKANAQAVILAGNAEGEAIKAKGDALKDNPGLPTLVSAERWDGHLPTTMIPGSTVPFLKLGTSDAPPSQ